MSINEDFRSVKTELRNHYRALRATASPDERAAADAAISQRFLALDEYRRCDTILTYVSTAYEVDTHRIIQSALSDGKRVAVPRCVDGTRNMEFYYVSDLDDLVRGSYGILEPKVNRERLLLDTSSSLCIVPALSYDESGYRLGYGGGYYDRFLKEYEGLSVGICYCNCVREVLPRDIYDCHVSVLITEQYVRKIHTKGEK